MPSEITQRRNYGQFIVFYQYIKTQEMDHEQPCMILGVPNGLRKVAWVIPLSNAHAYADSKTGAPTDFLLESAFQICEMFGLYPSRSTIKKVADAIVDNLPELVEMPPKRDDPIDKEIERAVERHGLDVKVDGKSIIH